MPTRQALSTVTDHLRSTDADGLDALRTSVRFGLQTDVEVTDGPAPGPIVSQIFCSALPIAYSGLPAPAWSSFARLILEAAYEATLLAGMLNAVRGGSNRVLLTRLGGGAFGNDDAWIDGAMLWALQRAAEYDLDVVIVSYGRPTNALKAFVRGSGFSTSSRLSA